MAYNKSKHIDAALKYLNQGKLPQAIDEYQQILKHEPKDQVTLMTLGDLFVRKGETFRALEYFERLAQIFLNDGFTTKAIAIYKKVAKLAPEESRPIERLAELYVQQGVISEARPLYLQLAEAALRAGKQPQAEGLLRKLFEAEPDNLRVQTRLAELQLTMGKKKEAIETFRDAMQRLLDRREASDAIRMADRILQIDPQDTATQLLKARALSESGKNSEAAVLLESVTGHEPGDENSSLLFDEYMNGGQTDKAAELAEKAFARESKNFPLVFRVANIFLEGKQVDRAKQLLDQVRKPMMESGEHDPLAQSISRLAELRPGDIQPLEWLVNLYATTSDSFRLPDALAELAAAHEAAGDDSKALETYEQLLDRSPENERTRRKVVQLRAKLGLPGPVTSAPVKLPPQETAPKPAAEPVAEPELDEENQRFVTQALTDVDLFSSYGLTQKAIDVLDTVLERIPGHVPTLERLLDLSVAGGDDRRTVELATKLKYIATERNDHAAAERYENFCRRFQQASGLKADQKTAGATSSETVAAVPPAPVVEEFSVPMIDAELAEPAIEKTSMPVESAPAESAVHEVDLSDEWAALSEQLDEPGSSLGAESAKEHSTPEKLPEKAAQPSAPPMPEPAAPAEIPAFELELQPAAISAEEAPRDAVSVDSFLDDLAGEFASAASSLGVPMGNSAPGAPEISEWAKPLPVAAPTNGASTKPANIGPLGDVFEQFRSDMGESDTKDEDPEVHYNLGVAYREMGLLDEAISEFQKVSRVPEFRYAMQCCTLLGLAFQEKGEPSIAAMWYERALMTPGLDQEAILALQYDLGISQELAGERNAAFQSFSKVYAMNIDYRDVAERMALLVKARGDAP